MVWRVQLNRLAIRCWVRPSMKERRKTVISEGGFMGVSVSRLVTMAMRLTAFCCSSGSGCGAKRARSSPGGLVGSRMPAGVRVKVVWRGRNSAPAVVRSW